MGGLRWSRGEFRDHKGSTGLGGERKDKEVSESAGFVTQGRL